MDYCILKEVEMITFGEVTEVSNPILFTKDLTPSLTRVLLVDFSHFTCQWG